MEENSRSEEEEENQVAVIPRYNYFFILLLDQLLNCKPISPTEQATPYFQCIICVTYYFYYTIGILKLKLQISNIIIIQKITYLDPCIFSVVGQTIYLSFI